MSVLEQFSINSYVLSKLKKPVMRRFTFFLIFIPSFCLSQPTITQDSLLKYFSEIINEYRKINGLEKLVINPKLKRATDYWAWKMAEIGVVSHGSNSDDFMNRLNRFGCISAGEFALENCTELMTPDIPIKTSVKTYPDLKRYIEGSYFKSLTQYEYAMYGFLMWKNSPAHNKGMLNPKTKYFYLSSYKRNGRTYLCYIAYG